MKSGSFWIGMIVGAVVGAALGMIYAPKPGEETRGQLGEGVKKITDAAAQKGRGLLRRGRGMVEEKSGQAQQALGELEQKSAEM